MIDIAEKTWGHKIANFYPNFAGEFNDWNVYAQMGYRGFNEDLTHLLAVKFRWACVVLLCCLCALPNAQNLDAKHQIEYLKEGTLYVVLPTFRQKYRALQNRLDTELTTRERSRTLQLLEETTIQRDSFARQLNHAFNVAYHFSTYIFIKDQDVPDVRKNIGVKDEPFTFFLHHGNTENGASALIISDHRRRTLQRPIPYFARTGSASALFEAFFGSSGLPWRDLTKVVLKLDQKLSRCHERLH